MIRLHIFPKLSRRGQPLLKGGGVRPQIFFYVSKDILGGQLNLRSNKRSNSNFDCRNGFLGVDYICLDASHDKIKFFFKIVNGGLPPSGICIPTLIFFYFGRSTRFSVKRKVKFEFRLQKWIPRG